MEKETWKKKLTQNQSPMTFDSEDDNNGLDKENIQRCGRELEGIAAQFWHSICSTALPVPTSLLQGYEYTKFKLKPYDRNLLGDIRSTPTQAEAVKACTIKTLAPNFTRKAKVLH